MVDGTIWLPVTLNRSCLNNSIFKRNSLNVTGNDCLATALSVVMNVFASFACQYFCWPKTTEQNNMEIIREVNLNIGSISASQLLYYGWEHIKAMKIKKNPGIFHD